jgi:hypothetical protein
MDPRKLPQLPTLELTNASLVTISQSLPSAGIRNTGATNGAAASDNEALL